MNNTTLLRSDTIEKVLSGTLIQHGKLNDRIYLLKLNTGDIPEIFSYLTDLAYSNKYSKIICKTPKSYAPAFFANGFIMEAYIPGFYRQEEDMFLVSKFLSSDRILNIETNELELLSNLLENTKPKEQSLNRKFSFRELTKDDTWEITNIFKTVFKTYPFPVHEEAYIRQTMEDNVRYFGSFHQNKLTAIASSEIDYQSENAEMTDFATHPDYKGNNLASQLLNIMEAEMKKGKIKTLYTIARLKSIPMNLTFIRNNYEYSGTLIKNTNISGDIESMNIYYKQL